MKNETKIYSRPVITVFGSMIKETKGNGGSSVDGNKSLTQSGQGND